MQLDEHRTSTRTPGLKSLDELFTELVPAEGRAKTVQGELVRAINNLGYEYENNGNCNWAFSRRAFEAQLSFLQDYLLKGIPTDSELHRALGTLEEAGSNSHFADTHSARIHKAINAVKLAVRQWCHRNPTLIPLVG